MSSELEIFNAIANEEVETFARPRTEKKVPPVNHKIEVGELVYTLYGKNAPPLFYAHANSFVTKMLTDGYQWWLVKNKLTDALVWCRKKNANHAGFRTVLSKIANQ